MAVTIKDVAKLAGVSPSTVSRTCKNHPSISQQTKDRVKKAMEELGKLEEERRNKKIYGLAREKGVAGNEMCTFLIINISSLQLIPVNVIAYRSQYGSVNPAAVIAPSLAATLLSAAAAIVFCKVMDGRKSL